MDNEPQNLEQPLAPMKKDRLLSYSILISAMILAGAWIYTQGLKVTDQHDHTASVSDSLVSVSVQEESVLPSKGVLLPVTWGNLGSQLAAAGVIDAEKFAAIYQQRGAFTNEYKNLLLGKNNGQMKMTPENSGYLLNLFWALGLANKNAILDSGEMQNPLYGGAGRFASTAGWTITQGDPMDHFSRHAFFTLTTEQQNLVDRVSRGIYRPCCGNSTHFPDCNHGMAMLGLLELMASQGVSEEEMWKVALAVNSYWFPDKYLTIAAYLKTQGIEWSAADAKEILGKNYSSSSGYANIAARVVAPKGQGGGGGCGVDSSPTPAVAPKKSSGGCGI